MLVMTAAAIRPCAARRADAPAVIHPLEWPAAAAAGSAIDPKTEQFVEQLIGTMSTQGKVGQLIQADIDSIRPEDLRKYKLRSIEAGGNAAPGGDVRTSAARWLDLVDEFNRASVEGASPAHAAIPILFAIDAVHGHARIRGATVFPQNVGQATADEIAAT